MMFRNKKGSIIFDLIILIIMGMLVLLFLGLWKYGVNLITEPLLAFPDSGGISIANATAKTVGVYNDNMDKLHMIALMIFMGMIISIFISSFFTRSHPVFFVIAIVVTIFSVIFSVYVSNAYETLLSNATLGTTLQGFTAMNYIMLNLPVVIAVVGIFGAIIMFMGAVKPQELVGDVA